jgi:hypothetical protein
VVFQRVANPNPIPILTFPLKGKGLKAQCWEFFLLIGEKTEWLKISANIGKNGEINLPARGEKGRDNVLWGVISLLTKQGWCCSTIHL